jgi:hypothetical protein
MAGFQVLGILDLPGGQGPRPMDFRANFSFAVFQVSAFRSVFMV